MPLRHAILATSLAFAGCGGGGSQGPVTVSLFATPGLGGYVSASGFHFVSSGSVFILVGDILTGAGEEGARGFLSFDLDPIPAGASVLSATLQVTQSNVKNAPYPTLGSLVVDQVVYGNVFEAGAYDRTFPLNQGLAILSTDASLGVKEADVKDAVEVDLAQARTQSQFRLRFAVETNLNGEEDWAAISPAEGNTVDRPVLVVTYQP